MVGDVYDLRPKIKTICEWCSTICAYLDCPKHSVFWEMNCSIFSPIVGQCIDEGVFTYVPLTLYRYLQFTR